jgi:aryl-alcohol dehydrogenase-like predicted oxidoreductase
MELRSLGSTSTKVSAIGMGTSGIGGITTNALGARNAKDTSRDAEWIKLLKLGIDLGMTYIDTAERHAGGHCEEIIGEAIKGVREKVFIATKFSPEDNSYDRVLDAAGRSLRRLGTNYIDLFQIHWPNPRVPLEETTSALQRLLKEEKINYVGLCNFSVRQTKEVLLYLPPENLVAISHGYNLLERSPENNLIPFCKEKGLTFVAYTPFLYGMMTAKNDQRIVDLSKIAKENNISVAQLILNWVLRESKLITIPKTSKESHLRENAAALDFKVGSKDLEQISKLFEDNIQYIPSDLISVPSASGDGTNRILYNTLDQAIKNPLNMIPSPVEMAKQISDGDEFKPIKVQSANVDGVKSYSLEGKPPVVVRYWAWVIAHNGKAPIPSIIHDVS